MKHTDAMACLDCELLKFVRDVRPSEEKLLDWLGATAEFGQFHVLRKAGLLLLRDGHVTLSTEHLSADGSFFFYGNRIHKIDEDVVLIVFMGPKNVE